MQINIWICISFWQLISGDDDLPKRDDIGERRRNHELRVLAGAGIKSNDNSDDEPNAQDVDGSADMEVDNATESESESDLEFYKQVEAQHKAKLASKSEKYSRYLLLCSKLISACSTTSKLFRIVKLQIR